MTDKKDDKQPNNNDYDEGRRNFLKNTGIAIGGVAGGTVLGALAMRGFQTDDEQTVDEVVDEELQHARTFFSRRDDFLTLAEATERIYPEDDHGPGAIALGVPYFIDRQLVGFWGTNSTDYMKGPFNYKRSETHGLQSKLTRGDMFLISLKRMREVSEEKFGETFTDLSGEQQDEVLKMFEAGEVEIDGVLSDYFFSLLRQMTIEGVYADPAYGGNKNMQGWEMIGYPGPRMGWQDLIDEEDFVEMEPTSLRDYQGGGI